MTRDLLLATLFSLGLHLALLFGDRDRTGRGAPPPPVDPPGDLIPVDLPPLEPDEPELIDPPEADRRPLDLAPPMQADQPQPERPDVFMQRMQPPPPVGPAISPHLTVVPAVRDPRAFEAITVFDVKMLDQAPAPRFQARPTYPFELRRQGIGGEVVVEFIVDAHGEVQQARALRSTHREFEAAAVAAVAKWKFRPGRKGGAAVPTRLQVPVVFTLHEG